MTGRLHLHGPHLRPSATLVSVLTVLTPFFVLLIFAILLSLLAPWA